MLINHNIPGFLCKNSKLVENSHEFPLLKDLVCLLLKKEGIRVVINVPLTLCCTDKSIA